MTSMWFLLSSIACDRCLTNIFNLSSCLKASKTILLILITCSSLLDGLGIIPTRDSESDFYKKKTLYKYMSIYLGIYSIIVQINLNYR